MKLSEHSPHLKVEFSDKNDIMFESLTHGSRKSVAWMCRLGHEWNQTPNNRTNAGSGCPTCAGKTVLNGFNDLVTKDPSLAGEWSPNNTLRPEEVTIRSNKVIWWVCSEGHEYQAMVSNRSRGTGCPVCVGKVIIEGVNDISTVTPDIAAQWSNRNSVDIKSIGKSYKGRAYWQCDLGHEWKVSPDHRRNGTGCPECAARAQTSRGENELFTYLKSLDDSATQSDRTLIPPMEIDILIPGKLAVEYNGLYWHSKKNKVYHKNKYDACKSAGIQLITVWEDDWKNNKDVVKSMVKSKLIESESIGARKTKAKRIKFNTAAKFLNKHHIQGSSKGSSYIGLYEDSLVAVAVFRNHKGHIYLERYASSKTIVGGLVQPSIRYRAVRESNVTARTIVFHHLVEATNNCF